MFQNLSVEIAKLSDMLLPWKPKDLKHPNRTVPDSVTIETIKNQLHVLAEECKTGPIKHRRGAPGQDELRHVVEHFMKLFDVDDVTGTFARMNDIYVKNSEMSNVLRTLKDLLGLGKYVFRILCNAQCKLHGCGIFYLFHLFVYV